MVHFSEKLIFISEAQLQINGFGFCNDFCDNNQVFISQSTPSSAYCSNIISCSLDSIICQITGSFNEGVVFVNVYIDPASGCGINGNTSLTQIAIVKGKQ